MICNHSEISQVKVIGAGLAGCEAAWQLAKYGINVELYEMKPDKMTPAHTSSDFAELVCSNSFRSNDLTNAVGLIKEEMRRLGSLIVECADATSVPAGGALAVDRAGFASKVTESINNHPLIKVIHCELTELPNDNDIIIIATGPLTSDALANKLLSMFSDEKLLYFFDAAAPIVTYDSIDMNNAYFASRYDKGTPDYINCPMSKEEYIAFYKELISAEEVQLKDFEDKKVFEGCVPIEVMARRGEDTMRFGPLKPVGLSNPKTGETPYAVVQLRKDNAEGTLYNLVGFQTHLKFHEQKRVFSMIPALHDAEFTRFGVMHRNTFLDSPKLLDRYFRLRSQPNIRFAGQITGVEGYVESAASGLLVGMETAIEILNLPPMNFSRETAIGALALYISTDSVGSFQPMNINFGIIDSLEYKVKGKRNKNLELSKRALGEIDNKLNFYCKEQCYENNC